MTTPHVSVAGIAATSLSLYQGFTGTWMADVSFDQSIDLLGPQTITVGTRTFAGTVLVPSFNWNQKGTLRIVGGGAGWRKALPGRSWHNDLGLKASTVLQATADECGEALTFDSEDSRVGVDYVRLAGPAAWALRELAPEWWVDPAGVTHTLARASAPASGYEVLDYEHLLGHATLAVDDPLAVVPGSIITVGMVRDTYLKITKDSQRLEIYT